MDIQSMPKENQMQESSAIQQVPPTAPVSQIIKPPESTNKFIQRMTTPSNKFIAALQKVIPGRTIEIKPGSNIINTAHAQETGDVKADAGFEANRNRHETKVIGTKNGAVRTVPSTYAPVVQSSAAKYGISPKLLSAVINQESSMGTNPANFNPSIGSSAWLVGMTDIALKELRRRGIEASANTPQEAIDAAAAYISLAKDKYKNPLELYEKWYKTGKPLSGKNRKQFLESINVY